MKNKSGHHKTTNRFTFTTFADRVNLIDVRRSALYHLEHINVDTPAENETYFHNTLLRWRVLNLTSEFIKFAKQNDNIVTLPQLLHKKCEIIDSLLEHLADGNTLYLQPFLELLIALSRDLQEDFYEHFPKFLAALIKLLDTKDPERLEWTLICLAFLFKYLKSYLRRDISIILKSILPLLSEKTKWYIRNFAAESFAFVARDVKDKRKFLETILKYAQSDEDIITGCGHLLFEVIHGVKDQFHSCAPSFLDTYFMSLNNKAVNQKLWFDIMTQSIGDMLEGIQPKQSTVFWDSILIAVQSCVKECDDGSNNMGLKYILQLIGQCLEYKNGKFLLDSIPIVIQINNLCNMDLPADIAKIVSQIGVLLLLCTHVTMSHEDSVYVTKKLLSLRHSEIVTNFVQEVVQCFSFDVIVFPHFIDTIDVFNASIVCALSNICLKKSPMCRNGSNLFSWVKYPIPLGSKLDNFYEFIKCTFDHDMDDIFNDTNLYISIIMCLPHVKHIDFDFIKKVYSSSISYLLSREMDDSEQISITLFLLACTLESAIHTIDLKDLNEVCHIDRVLNVLMPLVNQERYICSLRILDLILTVMESEHAITYEMFERIYPVIEDNLLSANHEFRSLTSHICSLFEFVLTDIFDKNKETKHGESFKIFSLCYTTECLSLSVENYREQILKLSKTAFDTVQQKISADKIFKNFAFKYMLGFLHVNFKLLWEPVQSLVLSYANGMNVEEFWQIFYPCLAKTTEKIRNKSEVIQKSWDDFGDLNSIYTNLLKEYCESADNPDYDLYRIHLLNILSQAPNVCEPKNKFLTTSFLDFINFEFERNAKDLNAEDLTEDSDVKEVDGEKSSVSKSTYDTLIAYLKIYSKMQNPKALFKEQNLKTIFLNYLMHKNPIIQKVALDCLMRYKNKHWTPYKDNLYNLIDGKKFKEELRTFNIESSFDVVKSDDRPELMPILLRIVFSKMITNMGVDKKGGSQVRRSLVMRFIAGCQEDELLIFLDMAFKSFTDYFHLELNQMHSKIVSSLEDLKLFSPKKVLGSLNLLETMREQLIRPGEVKLLPRLLKILLCIATFVSKLHSLEDTKSGYRNILKNIQNLCIQSLGNFFKQFTEWPWQEQELLFVYDNIIWPVVEKLPVEGIHSPTSMLKLFHTWSQHSRYHKIFGIFNKDDGHTPIYYILQLVSNKKIHHSVLDLCMQIIENFLILDDNSSEEGLSISASNTIELDGRKWKIALNLKENLNVGSLVLIPYVPQLVNILRDRFENINPTKLQKRDLLIVSRVTELVSEPSSVDLLLKFSLPILIQRIAMLKTEENCDACIDALMKLLNKTTRPQSHVRTIVPLFSKVHTAHARKQLCESMKILSAQSDDTTKAALSTSVDIVIEMNATDEKWIEQPDYDRRFAVYKRIYEMFDADIIDVDLASLIVHNSFYTFANVNDISLKMNASDCLRKILPSLMIKYKGIDPFLHDTTISLIKHGLKSSNDNLKQESITILGVLVRDCPSASLIFSELHPLSNKIDKEVDFFENMQHLQIHRKCRALNKFCNFVKTSSRVPTPKTLISFVVPLASQYICNDKYVEKSSLVEAAIETIGAVSRVLPWHQYETTLKFYLEKMHSSTDHQKQLIKIISLILDAFHFDFSKVSDINSIISNIHSGADTEFNNKPPLQPQIKEDDDSVQESSVCEKGVLPFEKIHSLAPSTAKRAIFIVTSEILVRLNWSVGQAAEHEGLHKSLKKEGGNSRETDEKLRLPLGLAIVKLLQKLPQPMLKNNLPSVIIKICNFLKSPLINIRLLARDIISKIMVSVGAEYLNVLLSNLTALLTKGFQVHVLISTVHTVLLALQSQFVAKQMDKYLDDIIKVCLNDLFGQASEEKEVVKLGAKAPEAKPSKKCFLTLRIIAQNISDSSIIRLLCPFKNILENTHSKRVIIKVESCFQYISLGLIENKHVSMESSLIFLCGLLSDNIPRLSNKMKKVEQPIVTLEEPKPVKEDCFLIPPDPKGGKKTPKVRTAKTSAQANSHVITEFGLNMLHVLLQKDDPNALDCRPFIDPMIPFIVTSLKSNQVKVSTLALKCVTSLFVKRMKLPALKNNIEDVLGSIFAILHKYATSGISKRDENFHLVANGFKAVTSVIRNSNYYTFSIDQVKTLLLYAEHDIYDHEKQATAFSLLKAILSAKYDLPEIKEIINKISEMTILNESARTREEASQIMILYLSTYPSSKQLKSHIHFYASQLEYEMENGRMSAIKILLSLIENFAEATLINYSGFLFLSLGVRLANEVSKECRSQIIVCIEKLLSRLSTSKRNEMFNLTLTLISDHKFLHVEIAAHLLLIFVTVEKDSFKERLTIVLPKIVEKLYGDDVNVGRFVKLVQNTTNNIESDPKEKDNCYISLLNLLLIICDVFPNVLSDKEYVEWIDELAVNCQSLLAHPHVTVRIAASKFLLKVVQYLDSVLLNDGVIGKFLHSIESMKSFILDLVSQLIPGEVTEELASVVCENVTKTLLIVSKSPVKASLSEDSNEVVIDEQWITKKLKSVINAEVVKCPTNFTLRMTIFTNIEKIVDTLSADKLERVIQILSSCILRELSKTDPKYDSLKSLVIRLNSKINETLGNSKYNEIIAKAQAKIVHKKKDRKMKIVQDKVNNPERAAKRKSVLRDKKKEYKRRKLDKTKGRLGKRKANGDSIEVDTT